MTCTCILLAAERGAASTIQLKLKSDRNMRTRVHARTFLNATLLSI